MADSDLFRGVSTYLRESSDRAVFNFGPITAALGCTGVAIVCTSTPCPSDPKLGVASQPNQGVRYHLREQADASSQPSTKEELFNLRHARLRNCVERLNDVLKKRWRIIRDGPGQGSTIKKQVLFVWAISAVHNFINQHGQAEDEDDFLRELPDNPTVDDQDEGGAAQNNGGAAQDDQSEVLSDNEMVRFRDTLAREMWENLLIEDS